MHQGGGRREARRNPGRAHYRPGSLRADRRSGGGHGIGSHGGDHHAHHPSASHHFRSDEKLGEILGVHITGPEAFELIAEAVAAMESEATVETIMHTIHPHPTLSEVMGEGFNAVYGLAINA